MRIESLKRNGGIYLSLAFSFVKGQEIVSWHLCTHIETTIFELDLQMYLRVADHVSRVRGTMVTPTCPQGAWGCLVGHCFPPEVSWFCFVEIGLSVWQALFLKLLLEGPILFSVVLLFAKGCLLTTSSNRNTGMVANRTLAKHQSKCTDTKGLHHPEPQTPLGNISVTEASLALEISSSTSRHICVQSQPCGRRTWIGIYAWFTETEPCDWPCDCLTSFYATNSAWLTSWLTPFFFCLEGLSG